MSFVERLFLLCTLLGGSFIGGSTVSLHLYMYLVNIIFIEFNCFILLSVLNVLFVLYIILRERLHMILLCLVSTRHVLK